MTAPSTRTQVRRAWMALLLLLGFGCTVFGICLIAFSDSTRNIRIGFPVALWGVLLGAFALHGSRWTQAPADESTMADADSRGRELTVREFGELELERDAAARRAYEMQLEVMLRRQMEQVLREQVAQLRQDIAGLRGEVLEAVDGRLRLERIETTRIIGSDLAALQNEVRRLNVERDALPASSQRSGLSAGETITLGQWATSTQTGPSSVSHRELWTPTSTHESSAVRDSHLEPIGAESIVAESIGAQPSDEADVGSVSAPAGQPVAPPPVTVVEEVAVAAAEPEPEPEPESEAEPEPQPVPVPASKPEPVASDFTRDPFAGLPRLSSFDPAALVPKPLSAPRQAPRTPVPAAARGAVTHASAPVTTARPASEYVGRRRAAGAQPAAQPPAPAPTAPGGGTHSRGT